MEGDEPSFFFIPAYDDGINPNGMLALAKKIHLIQRHRELHRDSDGNLRSVTPDLEHSDHLEVEPVKVQSSLPVFFSIWNKDTYLAKHKFDSVRWNAASLLTELAKYLYFHQWTSPNGGTVVKLNPATSKLHYVLIEFLRHDYKELTNGTSLIYYRWQSQKLHQRYLRDIKSVDNEVAGSVAGTNKGVSLAGGSISDQARQMGGKGIRVGSSTSRSDMSSGSHGDEIKFRGKRRNENKSIWKSDRSQLGRYQYTWSAYYRAQQKSMENQMEQPFFFKDTKYTAITAESGPNVHSARTESSKVSVPPPNDIIRSNLYLTRVVEIFREMRRKRECEDQKWIDTGRSFVCRVICYGDRRSAMLSRSKSAVIPTTAENLAATTTTFQNSISLPSSAKKIQRSAKDTSRTQLMSMTSMSKLGALDCQKAGSTTPAFPVYSSFNHDISVKSFGITDAMRGKVPQSLLGAKVYRRSIFVTSLPDGSFSAFYQNGRPAVIQSCYFSKFTPVSSHTTTLAFDRTLNSDIILSATPQSLSAYAPAKDQRLFITEKNITLISAQVHVETFKKWTTSKRLDPALNFVMNSYLTLTVQSHEQIYLTFNHPATSEAFKFLIKLNFTDTIPPSDFKFLQVNDQNLSSQNALELMKPAAKSKGSTHYQSRTQSKVSLSKGEQLAKKLGFIDNSYVTDASAHVERLRNKISWICESWLSHYCLWLGITEMREKPASRHFNKRLARRMAHSAGLPGQHLSDDEVQSVAMSEDDSNKQRKRGKRPSSVDSTTTITPVPSDPSLKLTRTVSRVLSRSIPQADGKQSQQDRVKSPAGQRPVSPSNAASPVPTTTDQSSKIPSKLGLTDLQIIGVCPPTLKRHMVDGGLDASAAQSKFCQCSRKMPPVVSDIELDLLLSKFAPQNQMVVIQVVNSKIRPDQNCGSEALIDEYEEMYNDLYSSLCMYRPRPCFDSISDRFRMLRYDLATAASRPFKRHQSTDLMRSSSARKVPLLIRRHNVRRGMTMMYHSGGLISCGFISPGKADSLLRQIDQSWRLALQGFVLPHDYRLSAATSVVRPASMPSRDSDYFVAKYLPKNSETNVPQSRQTNDVDLFSRQLVTQESVDHRSRDYPCLHMSSA